MESKESKKSVIEKMKADLNEKVQMYRKRYTEHQKRSYQYKVGYYSLGTFLCILSVTLASLSSLDLESATDKWKFILSVLVGVLSTVLNFVALEKRIQEHHDAKINYITICKDLKKDLLSVDTNDPDILQGLETLYIEKEKLIIATEPSLYMSWCSNLDDY